MSDHLSWFAQLIERLFAIALRLYPVEVQREYASEMKAVLCMKTEDAARQNFWMLFTLTFREVCDLPPAIVSAHFHVMRGRMNLSFPSISDRTPWLKAILSLLPFFFAGSIRIILIFQPGWMPDQRSQFYFLFLLLSFLVVTAGFVLGIVKKFPRWAYPYPFYLAFSFYILIMNAIYLFQWNIKLYNSFILFLAAILLALWLPGLRSFYKNISQDWTLLSYGLYGLVLFLLSTIDKGETPQLTLMVLLPSLISLCAALAHLRIRSVVIRMAILFVGTFAGLFIWLIPIFRGMITPWLGVGVGLLMLLAYWVPLTAIMLSPLLVNRAIHFWRTSRTMQ